MSSAHALPSDGGPGQLKMYTMRVLAFVCGEILPHWNTDTRSYTGTLPTSDHDVDVMLEELRRQLDGVMSQLEAVRARSLRLVAFAAVILTLALTILRSVDDVVSFVVWIVGVAFLAACALGVAANAVGTQRLRIVNVFALSATAGKPNGQLVLAYYETLPECRSCVDTGLTMIGIAILFQVASLAAIVAAWLLNVA